MKNIYLYTAIFSFLTLNVFSQEEKNDLGTEVINVVKAYSPEVSDAYKIQSNPDSKVEDVEKQKIEYNTYTTDVASTFSPSKMKARSQVKDGKSKMDLNNFFVLGYGNYKTPLVEIYLNNKDVKKQRYGVHVQHLSSEGGIEDVRFNDAFMNTSIDGFYWKQFKNYQLKTNIAYIYQSVNWYGVPSAITTDALVKDLNVGQFYQTIQGDVSYTNNGKNTESVFRSTSLSAYRMSDRYDSYENRVVLYGDFAIPIEGEIIRIEADLDYMDNSFAQGIGTTSEINNKYFNVGLTPSLVVVKDNMKFNLGINIAYSADLDGDNNQFKVYPRLGASINVVDELMIAYAELTGEMKQNSYQSIVDRMPYLSPTMDIKPTSVQYNFIAGLKGKLASNISYKTSVSFRKESGFVQFVKAPGVATPTNGWEAWNSFSAVQDTVNIMEIYAGVEYNVMKDLKVSADLTLNTFSTKVYNTPSFNMTLAGEYRFMEDFTIGTSMYLVGDRNYRNNLLSVSPNITEEGSLPGYFDLNINGGYDVTNKLGTFVRFNNILGNKYELYSNYPVQGFQVMAGITYKF